MAIALNVISDELDTRYTVKNTPIHKCTNRLLRKITVYRMVDSAEPSSEKNDL